MARDVLTWAAVTFVAATVSGAAGFAALIELPRRSACFAKEVNKIYSLRAPRITLTCGEGQILPPPPYDLGNYLADFQNSNANRKFRKSLLRKPSVIDLG